jgi:hypothetical protein
MHFYSSEFFDGIHATSLGSAREIVPLVLRYVQPQSVIDVGCGIGTWLSVFKEHGIKKIYGVDGPWVDKGSLLIPEGCFQALNLEESLHLEIKVDLAISLEVAEHLPTRCAENFIDSLVRLAPVVLFSAAIPLQGGTHHLNEQWPEYWAHLFSERGYAVIDCLRHKIWNNNNIALWFRQNLLIFIKSAEINNYSLLRDEYKDLCNLPLAIVHPENYLKLSDYRNLSLRKTLKVLPSLIKRSIKHKIEKLRMPISRG